MEASEPFEYESAYGSPAFWKAHGPKLGVAAVFLLTVVLTVVSFPPFQTPEFAYVFAAPAILWAYRRPSFKVFAWTMFGAQSVAWFTLLFWLHHVSWLGLVLLAPFVGAWVGVWYLAVWWAMPQILRRATSTRVIAILGLAGLWVVLEWTRNWFLTGFPWLPLSASQWQRTMLLQIASYTGASGISFLLIVFNLGFTAYAHRLFFEKQKGLKKRSPEFMAAILVLMFMAFLPLREVFGQKREFLGRVAVVQPNIPQDVKWDPAKAPAIIQTLEEVTAGAAEKFPELIIWPESVMPLTLQRSESARKWIEGVSKRSKAPILLGSDSVEADTSGGESWYNSAFVVDPESGVQERTYAKRHLVPFGEYVPMRPLLGWLNKIVPVGDGDFQPGTTASPLVIGTRQEPFVVGPLICYEDLFPELSRESVKAGAALLVVMTNDAWYGEGAAAYQHAAHSVLRAVETRRPVIRCGNAGWSGWIDEYGNIRGAATNGDGSVYFRGSRNFTVTRDMRWDGRDSLYVQHGDWFIGLSAALAVLGYLGLRYSAEVEPEPAQV